MDLCRQDGVDNIADELLNPKSSTRVSDVNLGARMHVLFPLLYV